MILRKKYSVSKAYARIQEVTGTTSYNSLAVFLGVSQNAVAKIIKRNTIVPSSWLLVILKEKGINPEWIEHGDDYPKFLLPVETDILQ